jgi:hypothetical protein
VGVLSAKVVRGQGQGLLLASRGGGRWLSDAEAGALRDEVLPDDRLDMRRAIALVDYGLDTGTGIQVVPPA